ncbi:MAG: phosphotransferase [Alphaproteobacteria bacterium PA2]|nr:MAG: phosphotransferase [Alphaproteobacteria bacterium PA2]
MCGSVLLAVLCWSAPHLALAQSLTHAPDLILTGTLLGKDHQTYREDAFRVPAGVRRLTLDFSYSGKSERTTLDIGLRDPVRFRGWSGGARSRLVVAEGLATPAYLAGPLPAGMWKLIIGVPNIRKVARTDYTARIWFDRTGERDGDIQALPAAKGASWYRGDLHAHTAHSDGTCLASSGQRIPCPVFKTLEAARSRGLDFLAVTDHNTFAQNQSLTELAPYFDTLLLIPGREITTFQGHTNVWGPDGDLDFQLGTRRARTTDAIFDQAHAAQGLVSINHPRLPSGEACMGCGWSAATDWSKVDAMEVINGGSLAVLGPEGPVSGIPFWEGLLDRGFRITGVGGSDNHDPDLAADKPGALGRPLTYVHADALSRAGILEGIRQGRVFLDIRGLDRARLEVRATSGEQSVEMGGVLKLQPGAEVTLRVDVSGLPAGARLTVRGNGAGSFANRDWGLESGHVDLKLAFSGAASWLRFDARDAAGGLMILGNPVYLTPAP